METKALSVCTCIVLLILQYASDDSNFIVLTGPNMVRLYVVCDYFDLEDKNETSRLTPSYLGRVLSDDTFHLFMSSFV